MVAPVPLLPSSLSVLLWWPQQVPWTQMAAAAAQPAAAARLPAAAPATTSALMETTTRTRGCLTTSFPEREKLSGEVGARRLTGEVLGRLPALGLVLQLDAGLKAEAAVAQGVLGSLQVWVVVILGQLSQTQQAKGVAVPR